MLSEKEEDIFLKKILKKHRSKNSMKEIKTEKINPSKKKQRFFFEALAFEENYKGNALEKEEVNDENKEIIFTLKDGIKIIYKYEKNTIDLNDTEAKFLKIEKYDNDNDIMAEYFYHYGLLKKIIYYNKDRSINNINYFDIYYSLQKYEISSINSDLLLEMNKYFEVKTLKEKDIKIYREIDYKFYFLGNYSSNTLSQNSEALTLKILKDNVKISQRDIKSFIYNLKSFPTVTEYYSNNKIIKKDIYKVERIVRVVAEKICQISYKQIFLIGKLEKTDYFQEKVPVLENKNFVEENIEGNVEGDFLQQEEEFLEELLEKYLDEKDNKEVNTEKKERVYTFKNKTKIIHKYEENAVDLDEFEDELLKIEKYNKNRKIEVECFYHHGFLKKIIYYNKEQTINKIDYFDIYYAKEETSLSYIYSDFNFYNLDKYFETKFLKESDIKIYTNREYGFNFLGNYPSDMIKAEEEALMLRTLKENIKIERKDIKKYIDYFESFPTMTEYYSNGKIIKKDIYKVERIMEISHPCDLDANLSLNGVLEKTEKYNDNNEIVEIKKLNRHIYVVNVGFGDYLPRIEFDD